MSTDPLKNDPQGYEMPCWLDPAEFDFSTAVTSEQGALSSGLKICATLQEETEIDCTEAVSTGPAVVLRLTLRLAPGADPEHCTREFVELLQALNDLDLALGGRGLVLDQALSSATGNLMTVVLCPLDVRWSVDRFKQMAILLGGFSEAPSTNEPSNPTSIDRIAEVISQYGRRNGEVTESPHDRVQSWRGRRPWLTGLQMELLRSRF